MKLIALLFVLLAFHAESEIEADEEEVETETDMVGCNPTGFVKESDKEMSGRTAKCCSDTVRKTRKERSTSSLDCAHFQSPIDTQMILCFFFTALWHNLLVCLMGNTLVWWGTLFSLPLILGKIYKIPRIS